MICFVMEWKKDEHGGAAFLLAQLGSHAAAQFAERLRELQLTPPDAGILRILRTATGISQRELSARLQVHPSRLVALLDKLERGKFIERKPNADDRRLYSLHITKAGGELLVKVGQIARQHQEAICMGLSKEERQTLTRFLERLANAQGLIPGVHPGYGRLEDKRERRDE